MNVLSSRKELINSSDLLGRIAAALLKGGLYEQVSSFLTAIGVTYNVKVICSSVCPRIILGHFSGWGALRESWKERPRDGFVSQRECV